MQRFGRNSASGTYGYFKLRALCGGDFMPRVNELPGSASVVQAVAGSLNGIGYASIGFRASGVRLLPLAESERTMSHLPPPTCVTIATAVAPSLYLYQQSPQSTARTADRRVPRRVLSTAGQSLVNHDGYLPLPPAALQKTRQALGLQPLASATVQ